MADLFDLSRITHNTTDPIPDGVADFNPIKLYPSNELTGYMNTQKKDTSNLLG